MKNIVTPALLIGVFAALLGGIGIGYLLFHASDSGASGSSENLVQQVSSESIWTCSMHPQIRQNEPGDCPICGMDLIPLEENASTDPLVLEMTPEAVKLATIETTTLGTGTPSAKVLALSGKIQVDERLSASQVAHIAGRIEELYVSFKGETVRKGQKIASLYSPELVTAQQELLEALKMKDTYPDLLAAARQKLAYWKISDEQIAKIEQEGKIQENFILRADASGIVTQRKVAVGDYVKKGEVLLEMVNMNRLWVMLDAYEEDLAYIKVGDQVKFTTPALPNDTFKTRITFIDPVINPQTRVASLRGEIQNRSGQLKPEMFVQASLRAPKKNDEKLLVPKSAVLWTGRRSVVYVKVADAAVPSYRYQEVSLGERMGKNYVVESGLKEGDEVVTQGSFAIDAAAQLNNQASMINALVNKEETADQAGPNYVASTPQAFKDQLASLTQAYLKIKDALVKTDSALAATAAEAFSRQLDKVDMSLLKGEAHPFWMQQLDALQSHSIQIASEVKMEEKREQFSFLSLAMIEAVQALGVSGDTLYVQHCPMALDWEGADWLSDREVIRNPYFGDQMLKCGNVIAKLVPQDK